MQLSDKPKFSESEIPIIARRNYKLDISDVKLLPGERDQNFLIVTTTGDKYVLKISNQTEDKEFLAAQNSVMKHIYEKTGYCQNIYTDADKSDISQVSDEEGRSFMMRLASYIGGEPAGEAGVYNSSVLHGMGKMLGEIDASLTEYDDSVFIRKFDWDLQLFKSTIEKYAPLLKDDLLKQFIYDTLEDYNKRINPVKDKLRRSVIHNDANDYNIILDKGKGDLFYHSISGLIDFGDMVYSYTSANIAVLLAYIVLEADEPLERIRNVCKSYHDAYPITEIEADVIFTMMKMRLCISIVMAAYQQKERPDDDYLGISQEPIRKTIPLLNSIDPDFVAAMIRTTCGLHDNNESKINSILKAAEKAQPVTGNRFTEDNCIVLNLGVETTILDGDPSDWAEALVSYAVESTLKVSGKEYAIGRYNEARLLYSSGVFTSGEFNEGEDRTIHLGTDIFMPAGTAVFAPLDGTIEAFAYNPGELDYGHMIILSHEQDNTKFFTLYGHLSRESLKGLESGKKVMAGEIIATTGTPQENGGWTPHLHFQIITDLLTYGTGFPGVCKASETETWMRFSPDPNIILGVPQECFPDEKPGKQETLENRHTMLGSNLSLGYKDHIKILRGWKQYLYDDRGHKYLDAYNNVPHIGHCHPEVIEAATKQMKLVNTNTRYLSDNIIDYAELLLSTFPDELEVCYFLNSASEANELAIRMAYSYTGNRDVIVLEGAYHGNTNLLIDISPYKHDGPGGRGAPEWVHTAPLADCYRGEFKYDDREAGVKYAARIEEILNSEMKDKAPAAFIAETCPSVGGQIIFPEGYLKNAYSHIRKAGGVCIADEVQTAYGRMGKSFYAFGDQGVIPDIVVLGKPIGNGHPIAAVIARRKIAEAFDNGMEFFSTFGGNNISCITGRKVLEIVLRDNYMDHARQVGDYLLNRFRDMKNQFRIVGDVRGSGLFLGIELVKDPESLEPAAKEASYIVNRLRDNNILAGTDGPLHNVLKIRPPMPFDLQNAEILADRLECILRMEID